METSKEEKELRIDDGLQRKSHSNNQSSRFSKLAIYSTHSLFVVLIAGSIIFGSWLAAGALLFLWGALVFSF